MRGQSSLASDDQAWFSEIILPVSEVLGGVLLACALHKPQVKSPQYMTGTQYGIQTETKKKLNIDQIPEPVSSREKTKVVDSRQELGVLHQYTTMSVGGISEALCVINYSYKENQKIFLKISISAWAVGMFLEISNDVFLRYSLIWKF